jgi:O-antigen ligase
MGFLGLILAALIINMRRGTQWSLLLKNNKALVIFYLYLLISVVWASSPFVSFKRWFKDVGNVVVAMVILTESNPIESIKAVFIRCGCLLIPLSLVFVRYFPELGRVYTIHSGMMEVTGVTFQKNSLGAMVLVCGMILLWDLIERKWRERGAPDRIEYALRVGVLLIGGYLLRISDSKTATVCLLLGTGVVLAPKLPILRKNITKLARYAFVGGGVLFGLDKLFGIKEAIVSSMGRDMTFTGRTDVWQALLDLHTDPVFGTGFCDIWSNIGYRERLPEWVAFSAHNGYLEMYLDGGVIGVALLVLLLLTVVFKIDRHLHGQSDYAVLRFAVLAITVLYAFSESIYGRISPNWFLFLLAALDYPRPEATNEPARHGMTIAGDLDSKEWAAFNV